MVGMQLSDFDHSPFSDKMKRRLERAEGNVHLATVHGSRLYGLAHEKSDTDYYIVADFDYHRSLQEVQGDVDVQLVPLHLFMQQIADGNPVALEALWSPTAVKSLAMEEVSRSFRVGQGRAQHGARTFIDMFIGEGRNPERMKNRRHVLRLAVQLRQAMEEGRFDPVLRPQAAELLTRIAEQHSGEEFWPVVDAWFDWASDIQEPLGARRVR